MKKNAASKPIGYSPTQEQEYRTITVLRTLFDPDKVVAHLSENDKTPNIDGIIEIINESRIPICKFEVQIKKLPKKYKISPRFNCPTSLFSYAEQSTMNPVLLICVDTEERKAYWIHIGERLLIENARKIERGQKTCLITFPTENCLSELTNGFIETWQNIFDKQIKKLKNFDALEKEHAFLRENSNPLIGISKPEIKNIHNYLDELNYLLEYQFDIVKKLYYPDSWKIGLAYHNYSDSNVTYEHYPIPNDKNDIQIKEITKELVKKFSSSRLELISYFHLNPINTKPKLQAIEYVEDKIERILEGKILDHKVNQFLAEEYVFAFVEKFHVQLGLSEKDTYSIDEIQYGFFIYMPLWVEEALIIETVSFIRRKPFFDPNFIIHFIHPDKLYEIDINVRLKLTKNPRIPKLLLGNSEFPFGIFIEMLTYLKSINTKNICRIYRKKDYSRLDASSSLRWNEYSPKDLEINLNIFFDNIINVYNAIVGKNFSNINNKIPIFYGANLIIFIFTAREKYLKMTDSPYYDMYYLKCDENSNIKIKIMSITQLNETSFIKDIQKKEEIIFEGLKYKLISEQTGILNFIFEDYPVQNYLYIALKNSLKGYFEKLKSENSQ